MSDLIADYVIKKECGFCRRINKKDARTCEECHRMFENEIEKTKWG